MSAQHATENSDSHMKRSANEMISDEDIDDANVKRVKTIDGDSNNPGEADAKSTKSAQASPAIVEDTTSDTRGNLIMTHGNPNETKRWRTHRMAEDYINLSSQMVFSATNVASFGYDSSSGQFPIESISALSLLTSPLRRPSVIEKWSPYEIAVFEAALSVEGKHFHKVQKHVKTKNTKEVIEFYYIWKKTAHYKVWKKQYIPPDEDVDSDDDY